jgi:hypothetical protein
MAAEFDFNELRAQLRSTLKRIVWHAEDWSQVTIKLTTHVISAFLVNSDADQDDNLRDPASKTPYRR